MDPARIRVPLFNLTYYYLKGIGIGFRWHPRMEIVKSNKIWNLLLYFCSLIIRIFVPTSSKSVSEKFSSHFLLHLQSARPNSLQLSFLGNIFRVFIITLKQLLYSGVRSAADIFLYLVTHLRPSQAQVISKPC